jgi:hypothetical protein
MGAGKSRVRAGRGVGVAVVGVAVLAGACSRASPSPFSSPTATGTATPTVAPSTVPVLGKLALPTFPATPDGIRALALCEQWSQLRGEYVARVRADTPFQLEQWFSSRVWRPAVSASNPLRTDPAYGDISVAFGLATSGASASIENARFLDRSCAAAD